MVIENLEMRPFNTSMMGVVKGVLDYFGIDVSDAVAFGGSGHAFLINVHEVICPSGPYCWKYDRFYSLLRNLGVEMTDLGFFDNGSGPKERAAVEQKLKEHLDRKQPCAVSNLDNQLIRGYTPEQFLLVQPWGDCCCATPPMLTFGTWQEFGDEVHANFFAFQKLAPKDNLAIARESLGYAVELFRSPQEYELEKYGIGPRAYDNWLGAVAEYGSSHGNWWNGTVWSECRKMAADYFDEMAHRLGGKVATPAQELGKAYREISELLAKVSSKELPADEKKTILVELKSREQAAIGKVEELAKLVA